MGNARDRQEQRMHAHSLELGDRAVEQLRANSNGAEIRDRIAQTIMLGVNIRTETQISTIAMRWSEASSEIIPFSLAALL